MANLIDSPSYTVNGVYQIAQTDKVEGAATGASFGGIGVSNEPHQNLANRTAFLYGRQNTNIGNITTLQGQVSALLGLVGLHGFQAITSVGTQYWTAPTYTDVATYLALFIITGGGGGGSNSSGTTPGAEYASGAGGGAGATIIGTLQVTGGETYSMTIGAGGGSQSNGASTILYAPNGNTLAEAAPGGGAAFQSATTSAGVGTLAGSALYAPFSGFILPNGQGGDGQSGAFSGVGGQGCASFWGAGMRSFATVAVSPGAYGSGGGGSYAGVGNGGSGQGGAAFILW